MKVVGRLSSSAIAVLPAPLQYRAIQRQQILELSSKQNYEALLTLSQEARKELSWWIQNLQLNNGRLLISPPPQLVIASDASLQGWGAYSKGHRTRGQWSGQEKNHHINILELKAAKLAILSFHRMFPEALSIHVQMDNIVVLTYLKKMGGTRNQVLTSISKQIWGYLLNHQITITVEYLLGKLNVEADAMSRYVRDSSEWKLNLQVFRDLCRARWTPCTDLFASRLSHQVPIYYAWKLDLYSKGQDAFQASLSHLRLYAFPPFSLIGRVLWKVRSDQATMLLITPAWQTQSWYPQLLHLSVQKPILLPISIDILTNPQREYHPLSQNSGLDGFREKLQAERISQKTASLITASRRRGKTSHYESVWCKWSGWCDRKQVDPFRSTVNSVLEFLSDMFDEGFEYNTIAGYRSALSAYHDPIDGVAVGKHPLVSSLMTGILNKRFPQPKYTFIWDVEKVVTYLSSLDCQNISDRSLTSKVTMLLALTSAARAHEICFLVTKYLVKHHTGYTFHFGKPTKTSKRNKI